MSNLNVWSPTWSAFEWLVNTQTTLHISLYNRIASACACVSASASALCSCSCLCLYTAYLFITCPCSRLMPHSINLLATPSQDRQYALWRSILTSPLCLTSRCVRFSHDSWCHPLFYHNVSCHRTPSIIFHIVSSVINENKTSTRVLCHCESETWKIRCSSIIMCSKAWCPKMWLKVWLLQM